ncbi:Mobile element protein [Bacillus badius]|nr:Mobile element protein [Bacillus badius]
MEELYSEAGCPSIDPMILINWTTFDKNCERRFKDTDLFERVFYRMLKIAAKKKLIRAERVFVDSIHVKASANKRKFEKKIVRKETIELVFADAYFAAINLLKMA